MISPSAVWAALTHSREQEVVEREQWRKMILDRLNKQLLEKVRGTPLVTVMLPLDSISTCEHRRMLFEPSWPQSGIARSQWQSTS